MTANIPLRPVGILPANTPGDLPAICVGYAFPRLSQRVMKHRFETKFSEAFGLGKSYAFGAGRIALTSILSALGIKEGDEVILPGYTCVAVPNPVIFAGATPIYADIDPATLNLDPLSAIGLVTPKTRAILIQHTFGYPMSAAAFDALRRKGVAIIEDCTHAMGARLGGQPVGTFGDAAFFSAEQSKIISTGAGGVASSLRSDIAEGIAEYVSSCRMPTSAEARRLMAYLACKVILQAPGVQTRFHGIANRLEYYVGRLGLSSGPETTDEEMNCRMPVDFQKLMGTAQARVGLTQLGRISWNLSRRRAIASIYFDRLAGSSIGLFAPPHDSLPAYVRFPIRVTDKEAFASAMRRKRIQAGLWFTAPVHPAEASQSAARYRAGSCPNAEKAVREVANLPCHPRMTDSDAHRVADAVLEFVRA